MKKAFLVCLLAFCLALIFQTNSIKATYIKDDANVLSNEAELEGIIADFYKQSDVIIMVETVDNTSDIHELARKRFLENKLDEEGTETLNMLILYSNDTKELTVAHADKCSLDTNSIMLLFADKKIADEIVKGNKDKGFLNTVTALKDKVVEKIKKDSSCSLGPALDFKVDSGIYEPPSQKNPYGRSLDKKLNPYDDGIVTVYDPLICILSNAGNLKEVEFAVEGTKTPIKKTATCKNGECSVSIPPTSLERGKLLTCSISIGGNKMSDKLIVANNIFVFFPVNQDSFGNSKEQYKFFLSVSEANKKPEISVKSIFLGRVNMDFNEKENYIKIGKYVMSTIYKGDPLYDIYILISGDINTKFKVCGYSQIFRDPPFIVISGTEICGTITYSLAHELGHLISRLCDEYSEYNMWIFQGSVLKNGCPNPYPECCKISADKSGSCLILYKSGETRCSGMPYKDKNIPSPESGLNAPYYSIMGGKMDKGIVYPIQAKCPLNNC